MILALVAITTTGAFAYDGYVECPTDFQYPDYGYNNTNSATYYDGISTSGTLSYSLYVEYMGQTQIDVGGGRTWRNGTPNSYQNGFFTGPFSYVYLSAYLGGPEGYCSASATW